MISINRQQYMAELSRLLGFMSSWDREAAITKYNALLDAAEDEAALMNELGTPTRLAIAIARDYTPTASPQEAAAKAQAEAPAAEDPAPDAETRIPSAADAGPSDAAEIPAPAEEPSAPDVGAVVPDSPSDTEEPFVGRDALIAAEDGPTDTEDPPAQEPGPVFSGDTELPPETLRALEAAIDRAQESELAEAPAPEREIPVPEAPAPAEPPEEEPAPEPAKRKLRVGALIAYLPLALVIGLPVAVALIALGVPFILLGGGLAVGAVYGVLELFGSLGMLSDILLLGGGGLAMLGLGALLALFGVWLSMTLGSAWLGGVVFRLGGRLCYGKEAARR